MGAKALSIYTCWQKWQKWQKCSVTHIFQVAEYWQKCGRIAVSTPPTQCGGKGPITGVSEAVRMVLVIFGPLPLCVYGVYGVGGCVWLLGVFMGVTFGMRPLYVASRGSRNTTPFG